MSRPRLIHVTTTDISLELLLGPQLSAFQDAGYEVIGASAPGPFVAALTQRGIRHEPLPHSTRSMDPRRDLAAGIALHKMLHDLRPDIVHLHNPKPGILGRIAGRSARVPVIVNTVHGLYAVPEDRFAKRAAVYTLERLAATCSHAELVQNAEDIATLRKLGVPDDRLVLLGNGIDLSVFDAKNGDARTRRELRDEFGARDDQVVFGAVGRMVWEKGYREIFEAAAALHGEDRIKFVIVGGLDTEKEDCISEADLADARRRADITFLGHRDDVADLYGAFDAYVLASYREGFPRSAMEAAATGLPLLATNIRGCRQVVDDRVNGRLVAPRDAQALADAVRELARDDEARSAMGKASIAKAHREFDQHTQIEITLDTYERLLRARSASPR